MKKRDINIVRMKLGFFALLLYFGLLSASVNSQTVAFDYDQDCEFVQFNDLSVLTGATDPIYNWDFGDFHLHQT